MKRTQNAAIQKNEWSLGYRVKKSRASYFMLAPYFVLFFFFTVLPVLTSISLSFTSFNVLEPPKLIFWQNYIRLFLFDDIFKIAIRNTMIFAVITGPISYFMCLIFAQYPVNRRHC
jgi:multiple sugar transport system permease protein